MFNMTVFGKFIIQQKINPLYYSGWKYPESFTMNTVIMNCKLTNFKSTFVAASRTERIMKDFF